MTSPNSNTVSLDGPLWVVVPAAGSGRRMGGALAKQYQMLDGISMLQRTLNALLNLSYVEKVVVVLAEDDKYWAQLDAANNGRILTTTGGSTRAQSVLNGIDSVLQHSATTNHWVLVHDAARPLLAASDVQRLISAVYNSGAPGGLLATPVHDTLKRADEHCASIETVNRNGLWQAQTPQMFRCSQLRDALASAIEHNAASVTDEASAMEISGVEPLLVEALEPNFKLTRRLDWHIATALLQAKRLNEYEPA